MDSEQLYSKSLSKMASKLSKACREIPGSLADAWRGVATEMESRSEVHRQFSNSMVEEIVKPLKVILDNHHKTRKSVCIIQICFQIFECIVEYCNIVSFRIVRLKAQSINQQEYYRNGEQLKPKLKNHRMQLHVKMKSYKMPC